MQLQRPRSENGRIPALGFAEEELSRQDLEVFCWDGLDRIAIKLQIRSDHLRDEAAGSTG